MKKRNLLLGSFLAFFLASSNLFAATQSISDPWVDGEVPTAAKWNSHETTFLAGINSVESDQIVNGAIVNIDVNASAAIDGTKIDPVYTNQDVLWDKGADVASGTSIALGTDGNYFDITGTTTIETITAKQAGSIVLLHFDDTLTLTDDTGNLELQGADIVVIAEDEIILASDGTNWNLSSRTPDKSKHLFNEQSSDISTAANQVAIYSKEGGDGTQSIAYIRNESDGAVNPALGIVQYVRSTIATQVSSTTVLPHDNTVPQITEGTEITTVAITPRNTNNRLLIEFSTWGSSESNQIEITAAIFQDATAGALYAISCGEVFTSTLNFWSCSGQHEMAAGTTSETTFRLRAGGDQANTTYINGDPSAALYGGVGVTYLMVTEIADGAKTT